MAIDTLKVSKRLREAGFTEPQAEAVAVQEATAGPELATKPDLAALRSGFKADFAELRAELRETELRLEAKIEAVRSELKTEIAATKTDILNRVFGLILGALVINIVAMIGAVFAVAKLLGH
jgi:molecular chaperone GrpE (heat shock protein)